MAISNLCFAAVIFFWFIGRGGDVALGIWASVLIGVSIVALSKSARRDPSRQLSGSKRSLNAVARQAFMLSFLYGLTPFIILPIAQGADVAILSGVAATSTVIGPYLAYAVPQAAFVWLAVTAIMFLTAFMSSGISALIICGICGVVIAVGIARAVTLESQLLTVSFIARKKLSEKQEIISLLLQEHEDNSSAWVWECDADGVITRSPQPLADMLIGEGNVWRDGVTISDLARRDKNLSNASLHEVIAQNFSSLKPIHDLQFEVTDTKGAARWISVRGKPVFGNSQEFLGYRGIVSETTEAKIAEDKIRFLAGHDALTKLPNRITFGDALAPWIEQKRPFATLHLDLDRFKLVNDSMGHLAGDELLTKVAERLQSTCVKFSSDAVVARVGGDEFVVGLPLDVSDDGLSVNVDIAKEVAQSIVDVLAQPFELKAGTANIGASVGYVVYPDDCDEPSQMPARADLALYRAKNEGRGRVARYTHAMDRRVHDRRMLEIDLANAISKNEMNVVYQPVVDLQNGVVTGVEALLRWNHSTLGMIGPDQFIPLAEESGAIIPIGAWVMEQACLEAASWDRPLTVAVNVSSKQILKDGFLEMVFAALTRSKLAPERLEIELTESVLVQDAEAALRAIKSLRKVGVSIALDDFGTGYSSLSYLRDFAFDKIKIDKSFISNLSTINPNDTQSGLTLVTAIVNLAKSLGMRTTAEGIEQDSQADELRTMGCDIGQGYLFSRPLSAKDLKKVIGLKPNQEAVKEAA
ncbi:MAG: EAL domain-containing protein [Ahrensia sp.]|nr:EAL domain-containing protein [Ahrensia sp.]